MAIDRAWWNALVDDDGSGNTGTVWNKAAIKGLLDAIDAMTPSGLWTPSDASGAALSIVASAQVYQKLNREVWAALSIQWPSNSNGAAAVIGGLPFPCIANNGGGVIGYTALTIPPPLMLVLPAGAASKIGFYAASNGGAVTNAQLSGALITG